MRHYSAERKEAVLKKLLPPYNRTYTELSKEECIPISTIYTWLKTRQKVGQMNSKVMRISTLWSVEARFSAIVETATMSELELGEYCREKGLYPEQMKQWKAEFISSLKGVSVSNEQEKTQGKDDKKRINHLEKELRRKEKALAEAAALLILGKKLQAFYGEGSEDA
jgi:transposase-like protein